MGKKGFKGIMLLLVVSCLFLIGGAGLAADVPIKIGITQIVDHPALNAVRDGLIDALEEEYGYVQGKDVVYDLQNAQGDMATANMIATKGKVSLRAAKEAINRGMDVDLHTGCDIETDAFSLCMASADAKEGTRAFLEKRKAIFKGSLIG